MGRIAASLYRARWTALPGHEVDLRVFDRWEDATAWLGRSHLAPPDRP